MSAPVPASRRGSSGSRPVGGSSTGSPAAWAACLTGEGSGVPLRRSRGRSGRVTTATTSWAEASSASSGGTAAAGVPRYTTRTPGPLQGLVGLDGEVRPVQVGGDALDLEVELALAPLLEGPLAVAPGQPLDEQHPVQVVDLMLHAAGQHPLAVHSQRLAAHVDGLDADLHGPLAGVVDAGEGQAALLAVLLALPAGDDRVDQQPERVLAGLLVGRDVVGEHALEHADLRRGQADAVGEPEGLQQGVAEAGQL